MKLILLVVFSVFFSVFAIAQSAPPIEFYKRCAKCTILAVVEAKYFNEADMQKLAEKLAKKYKNKKNVSINIFDRRAALNGYMAGVRWEISLPLDRRAFFIQTPNCGVKLIFSPAVGRWQAIQKEWKDTEECNSQIGISVPNEPVIETPVYIRKRAKNDPF